MSTEVHYHRPLTLHDRPLGRSWVVRMGRAKREIHFEFTTDAGLHCSGRQIGGFCDVAKGGPTPIPDRLRNTFERETAAV